MPWAKRLAYTINMMFRPPCEIKARRKGSFFTTRLSDCLCIVLLYEVSVLSNFGSKPRGAVERSGRLVALRP